MCVPASVCSLGNQGKVMAVAMVVKEGWGIKIDATVVDTQTRIETFLHIEQQQQQLGSKHH